MSPSGLDPKLGIVCSPGIHNQFTSHELKIADVILLKVEAGDQNYLHWAMFRPGTGSVPANKVSEPT